MIAFQKHIRRNSVVIQLSLLLFVAVLQERTAAQTEDHEFDIRVGNGSLMTSPGSKSIFLSISAERLVSSDAFPIVYLDKNIALSEEGKRLDFIVGVAPMLRLELGHDAPRFLIEAGIGVNLVSSRDIGSRQLGSNFLFSPTASAGVELPWLNGLLGVFYMFRHLSNAGMFQDNDGINFQYIVFSMSFRNF